MLLEEVLGELGQQFAEYQAWREGLGVPLTESTDQLLARLTAAASDLPPQWDQAVRSYRSRRARMGLGEADSRKAGREFVNREIARIMAVERRRDHQEYRRLMAARFAFGFVCAECGEEWWTDGEIPQCPSCGNPSRIVGVSRPVDPRVEGCE